MIRLQHCDLRCKDNSSKHEGMGHRGLGHGARGKGAGVRGKREKVGGRRSDDRRQKAEFPNYVTEI